MNDFYEEWKSIWFQAIGEVVDMDEGKHSDSILHFNIWKVDDDALRECFSIFPKGLDMLNRAKVVRKIKPKKVITDDSVLIGHLSETNFRLTKLLDNIGSERAISYQQKKNECTSSVVYRGNEDSRIQCMGEASPPTEYVDDLIGDLFEELFDASGTAAHSFLRDPFYYLANSVTLQNWIFWGALEDSYDIDPYAPELELFKVNAESGWNGKEMFVFQLDPD